MGMPVFRRKDLKMAKKRSYKFTNKEHSQKAVMSTVFGALGCISLVATVYLSYLQGGNAPVNYGIAAIWVLLFAIVGMILAVLGVQEKEKFKLFAWLGVILNFMALAGISGILYAGSYL